MLTQGAALAARVCALLLAIVPLLAFGASAAKDASMRAPARFASLQIDIWPEYDRKAALVILRGELAVDTVLPAALSLRIPASSGGPNAVAYASAADGQLLNLAYERIDSGEFITLRLHTPQRHVHVEFYEPIVVGVADRSYTYVWPGDLAVERLAVSLQEPAGTSSVSVQPVLSPAGTGANGLLYRAAQLGAFAAGKQLPIEIRYTKTDTRTSVEILGKSASASSAGLPAGAGGTLSAWPVMLAFAAALAAAAGAAWLWLRRRRKAQGSGFCPQCGGVLAAGSRYCAKCGARVAPE